MQIMHTVHNVTEDIDEFTSSPRVFFVTNKIIHGSLQGAVETEEVILQDWIQRENVCKDLLQHCIINISTLWQWDGEELCTHLHEQSLLPQFLVEDENIRICPDHAWVKVHDPQTLQTPSPGQSHISLAALKHTCQRDFHAVQRHSLKWEKTNKHWLQVRMTASYLYVWAQTGHLQGDFLAERSLHRFERIFWQWSYFQIQMSKIPTTPCCSSVSLLFCIHSSEEMQVFISLRYTSSAVDQTLVTHWSWPMNSITPEGPFIPLQPISESEVRI